MELEKIREVLKGDKKDIEYFKAYIKLYQVYYNMDLDTARKNAAGDLMHSDEFDDLIETLIDAYFELKNEEKK